MKEIDELKSEIETLKRRMTDFSVNATLGHMMTMSLIMEISRYGLITDEDLRQMLERTRARIVATAGDTIDENEVVRRATHFLSEMATVLSSR